MTPWTSVPRGLAQSITRSLHAAENRRRALVPSFGGTDIWQSISWLFTVQKLPGKALSRVPRRSGAAGMPADPWVCAGLGPASHPHPWPHTAPGTSPRQLQDLKIKVCHLAAASGFWEQPCTPSRCSGDLFMISDTGLISRAVGACPPFRSACRSDGRSSEPCHCWL